MLELWTNIHLRAIDKHGGFSKKTQDCLGKTVIPGYQKRIPLDKTSVFLADDSKLGEILAVKGDTFVPSFKSHNFSYAYTVWVRVTLKHPENGRVFCFEEETLVEILSLLEVGDAVTGNASLLGSGTGASASISRSNDSMTTLRESTAGSSSTSLYSSNTSTSVSKSLSSTSQLSSESIDAGS